MTHELNTLWKPTTLLVFNTSEVGSYQLYFGSPANRQNLATQTMCSPYTYPELSHTITPSCGICLHLKTPASYNQHPLLISNCPTWFKGHRCTQHHTRDIGHIINKFDLILITLIIKYDTYKMQSIFQISTVECSPSIFKITKAPPNLPLSLTQTQTQGNCWEALLQIEKY